MDYAAATAIETLMANSDLLHAAQLADPADGWRAYKPTVTAAKDRRGKREANAGTNIHSAVSALIAGRDLSLMPEVLMAPARLVVAELDALGVEVIDSERMSAALNVWPEPMAGTADLIVKYGGRLYVGDIKSVEGDGLGKKARYDSMAWAIQTTIYANGQPLPVGYEPERDRWDRPIIDPALRGRWPARMDRSTSIILEVARDGSGIISHAISLDPGLVRLACDVRMARKANFTTDMPMGRAAHVR
jgi:hypothetical protein